jgi:hypothetical protein
MRWEKRNPLGYEQASPVDWRMRLAEASARQMARHMGKPEKVVVIPESPRRRKSREQHEESRRLVERGPPVTGLRDPGRTGFYAKLRYGVLVETGVVRDAWRQSP